MLRLEKKIGKKNKVMLKGLKNFLLYFFIAVSLNVYGQVSFTATGPSIVEKGKPFTITYTVKSSEGASNFKAPQIPDFNYLGQSQSQASSFSTTIINGRIKTEKSITNSWYVTYEALKEGTFTIPAATVVVEGKTYSSNTLTIEVKKGEPITQKQQIPDIIQDDFDYLAENINKNLFLNAVTDKNTAYVGEPIFLYCKMYSLYDVNLKDFKPATLENFWSKDLPMPQQIKAERERINNKTFLTAILDKKVVFAQKPGDLSISPYQATLIIYDSWGFPAETRKIVSNSKQIKVKPLPANKPASFGGAVGQFDMKLKSTLKQLSLDQTYKLELTISGKGNLGLFDIPKINLPSGFEVVSTDSKNNITPTFDGLEGTMTVEYIFIPRIKGTFVIEPIEFSYFDYKREKYVTLRSDTLNFEVQGTDNQTTVAQPSVITTQLSKDIVYIKTKTKFLNARNLLIEKKLYWISYISAILLFGIFVVFLRKYISLYSNKAYILQQRATKNALKKINLAKKALKNNQIETFYVEILNALWGFVSDKFLIPLSELTRNTVKDKLKENKIPEELINELVEVIDSCEIARYSSSLIKTEPQKILEKTIGIINKLEKLV